MLSSPAFAGAYAALCLALTLTFVIISVFYGDLRYLAGAFMSSISGALQVYSTMFQGGE